MFKHIVEKGDGPGILAYDGDRAVGWCAIAPRSATPGLDRSPVAKPLDDAPAWSITCFYIDTQHRRHGMMAAVIEAAVEHARRNGARIVEAYPIDAERRALWGELFVGAASAFRASGFTEVARRTPTRPVMRRTLH